MSEPMNPEDRLRDAMQAYTEPIEPAPDAWARIRERVDRPTARSRRAQGWQRSLVGFAAAAAVVLLVVGMVALRSDDEDGEPGIAGPRVSTTPTEGMGGDEREPLPNFVAVKQDGTVVVITNADGREREIADGADLDTTLAVAPDGKRVYFDRPGSKSSECGPNREIVVVPVKGGDVDVVVENAADPAVSPNGKRLAYIEYPGPSGCLNPKSVVVERVKSGSRTRWSGDDNDVVFAPSWASDSRHLAFVQTGFDGVTTYRVLDVKKSESLADAEVIDLGPLPPMGPLGRAYGYFGHSNDLLAFLPDVAGLQLVIVDSETGDVMRALLQIETGEVPRSAVATPLGQNVLYISGSRLYVWQEVAPTPVAFTEGIIAATFLPAAPEE